MPRSSILNFFFFKTSTEEFSWNSQCIQRSKINLHSISELYLITSPATSFRLSLILYLPCALCFYTPNSMLIFHYAVCTTVYNCLHIVNPNLPLFFCHSDNKITNNYAFWRHRFHIKYIAWTTQCTCATFSLQPFPLSVML